MSKYLIGAYWGAREEIVDGAVDRLQAWLAALEGRGGDFSHWYKKGRSSKAQRPLDWRNTDEMRALMLAGRNRRDSDRASISELGFRVSAWSGSSGGPDWMVSQGKTITNPPLSNAVTLNVRTGDGGHDPASRRLDFVQLAEDMRDAFEPDRILVTSHELRERVACSMGSTRAVFGWETWLGKGAYAVDPGAEGVRDEGLYVRMSVGPFGEVAVADRLAELERNVVRL